MLNLQEIRRIISGQRTGLIASLIRPALRVASIPYGLVVRARNRRFDTGKAEIHRVDVPIICVGNLTVGGTGKTPMVAYLCRWFRERDVRVAVVSRGYGAEEGKQNDEALELAAQLPDVPQIQNPDRVAAARIAADELEMQVVVLDDGFQHRRLARDLDLVLIDATNPFGYDALLPAGLLREPVASLRRADVIALTRSDLISHEKREEIRSRVNRIAPDAAWIELAHTPTELVAPGVREDVAVLSGKKLLGFCGLGNPDAFKQTLVDCGAKVTDFIAFPDHHQYDRGDIQRIQKQAESCESELIVCTSKDMVKIQLDRLGAFSLRSLAVEQKLTAGEDALQEILDEFLSDEGGILPS